MKKIFLYAILMCAFAIYIFAQWPHQSQQLTVTMLNVGQGDAIYIRTPQGQDILIDGGPDREVLWELGAAMPPHDHTLEYVLATHPDADHIAGLAEIPDMFAVNTLISNGMQKETGAAQALQGWRAHTNMVTASRGQRIDIEPDLWFEFLHPDPAHMHGDAYNDDSLVFILHYKERTMLFTGDIEMEVEHDLVSLYGSALQVDLLKVGHHGSKTSSTQEFIDAVHPDIALISVGRDNTFGHPNAGVLWRLEQMGVQIFRTDQQGRIQCTSDGIAIECLPER